MGDDHPLPGMACFQAMCLCLPHVVGSSPFETIPWPVGPRNSGHSSAWTGVARYKMSTAVTANALCFMENSEERKDDRGRLSQTIILHSSQWPATCSSQLGRTIAYVSGSEIYI